VGALSTGRVSAAAGTLAFFARVEIALKMESVIK